jgi:hypothetical protein
MKRFADFTLYGSRSKKRVSSMKSLAGFSKLSPSKYSLVKKNVKV